MVRLHKDTDLNGKSKRIFSIKSIKLLTNLHNKIPNLLMYKSVQKSRMYSSVKARVVADFG